MTTACGSSSKLGRSTSGPRVSSPALTATCPARCGSSCGRRGCGNRRGAHDRVPVASGHGGAVCVRERSL
eukprot:3121370-Lingulodinium_polyedra.AAC.1